MTTLSIYKRLPCVDSDLFYGKVKFGPLGVGKLKKVHFCRARLLKSDTGCDYFAKVYVLACVHACVPAYVHACICPDLSGP